jgi:hypothetical protein
MNLIQEYNYLSDAEEAAKNLEQEGIIVHISSKHAHSLSSAVTGSLRVGLWVVLPNQYSDAVSLLGNKNNIVTSGLFAEEIAEFKKRAKNHSFNTLAKYSSCALISIVTFFVGICYLSTLNNGI